MQSYIKLISVDFSYIGQSSSMQSYIISVDFSYIGQLLGH